MAYIRTTSIGLIKKGIHSVEEPETRTQRISLEALQRENGIISAIFTKALLQALILCTGITLLYTTHILPDNRQWLTKLLCTIYSWFHGPNQASRPFSDLIFYQSYALHHTYLFMHFEIAYPRSGSANQPSEVLYLLLKDAAPIPGILEGHDSTYIPESEWAGGYLTTS